jgi:hypothetical protein
MSARRAAPTRRRPSIGLPLSLALLFFFTYASAAAVEEGPTLSPKGAAERWCHSTAAIHFNTWQLLVNLGNAIVLGEKTLVNAENAHFEEEARYRLRKAIATGNAARRQLVDFLEWQTVPASDPFTMTTVADGAVVDGAVVRNDDEELDRTKKAIPCIAIAIGVGVAAAGTAGVALTTGVLLNAANIRTLDQQQRATAWDVDQIQEQTANILAKHAVTTKEIEANFNASNDNIRALINRTEQLSVAYRTRTDMANSVTVLESLSIVARDLPQLVKSINATGIVHPAYVPTDVWTEARKLLHHDHSGRKLWLPESTGANATWSHRNQTLHIRVPASCDADPALLYATHKLQHYSTSLVLKFSGWTDAKVLRTEELAEYRRLAEQTAKDIAKNREKNEHLFKGIRTDFAQASVAVGMFLLLLIALLLSATCWLYRMRVRATRTIAAASLRRAEEGLAEGDRPLTLDTLALLLARHHQQPVPGHAHRYEPVPQQSPAPAYYETSLNVPASHKINAKRLRELSAEEAAEDSLNSIKKAGSTTLNPFLELDD